MPRLPLLRRVLPEHSSRGFETELRELRAQLLAMGARCERIVRFAFESFLQGTTEVAVQVVPLDAHIDRDNLEIHALILRILALRQPVADDLRFLATALRLTTDLERVGDEAVNIAERVVDGRTEASHAVERELDLMSATALEMLHLGLDALVRGDDAQANEVLGYDERVDGWCATVIAQTSAYISAHPAEATSGLRVIRVAKYLERIADHATNVAEQVIFMVRGEDVRHGGWHRRSRPSGAHGSAAPRPTRRSMRQGDE